MYKRMNLADVIRHHCTRCALHTGQLERELEEYLMPSDREIMMQIAWTHMGTWYKWGGDDPSGFDCSGLAMECLQSVGLVGSKEDMTAQGMWTRFALEQNKQVANPYEGCLVFWQDDLGNAIHVEICINEQLAIGAKGGGSFVRTVEDAIERNAFIKVRPIHTRSGIKGYVDPFMGA